MISPPPRLTTGLAVALIAAALTAPGPAACFDVVEIYVTPYFGYTWSRFRALEIDESFVSLSEEEEEAQEQGIELDPDDTNDPVGARSTYEGHGYSVAGSAGLRISGLGLGLHYAFTPTRLVGYSKRYRYDPDRNLARGRKFFDERTIHVQRVMGEIGYTLPVGGRFELGFRTHMGTIRVENNGLVMGRSVKDAAGVVGDVALELGLSPASFLTIEVAGWFGFYAFTGVYEGSFGTSVGLLLGLSFRI